MGDVGAALRAKLDGLLGETGLDPLDPNQPLRGYEIERVSYGPGREVGHGSVRMIYADGSSRLYRIPVVQSSQSWGRPGGWAYTGLDRLFAPHQELPSLPLAGPEAPMRLGLPERLPLPDRTHQAGSEPVHGGLVAGQSHHRWPRAQLETGMKAAELFGMPYQTYVKQAAFRAALDDLQKVQAVREKSKGEAA